MLNKLLSIFFVLSSTLSLAQMIEAESIPHRFEIDKSLEYEGESESKPFKIVQPKLLIRNIIEKELTSWYGKEGYKLEGSPEFDLEVSKKVKKIQPRIIQEVGLEMFEHNIPDWYFVQGSLQFEISLSGFKPFMISIPLAEVESFKNHFDKLNFSQQQFAYNEEDEFVVTYLHIYNPDNGKKYIFYNTQDESVKAPTFSISFNDIDR